MLTDLFAPETPPRVLWHYTSVEACEGIVSQGQLRAMDAQQMLDVAEQNFVFDRYMGITDARHVHGPLVEEFERAMLTSFTSTNPSSAEQARRAWTAYGSQEGGVALGFRSQALTRLPFEWRQVVYDVDEIDHVITRLHADVEQMRAPLRTSDYFQLIVTNTRKEWQATWSEWAQLTRLAVRYKQRSYEWEREWRLVLLSQMPPTARDDPRSQEYMRAEIAKRKHPHSQKNYVPVSLTPLSDFLVEIRLGSRVPAATRERLQALLPAQGAPDVPVEQIC